MSLRFLPLLLLAPAVAWSEPCTLDVAPAATLLVPYVSVEMKGEMPDPSGASTILRVTNTAAEAALIQLTIWSADGVPALALTEVLSGYDMWTLNFRDVLSGQWSAFDTSRDDKAWPNKDYQYPLIRKTFEWGPDGRSGFLAPAPFMVPYPTGLPLPQKTTVTPGGGCGMPYGDAAGLAAAPALVQALQAPLVARTHTGCDDWTYVFHPDGWLSKLGPDPLFFYATVDVVKACTSDDPADPGYLDGTLADRNVLIGDVLYLGGAKGTLEPIAAVHIQARLAEEGAANARGLYEATTGVEDRREPLPAAFAIRYANQTTATARFPRQSALMLWKTSSELAGADEVEDCGSYMYYAWDENEHVVTHGLSCPIGECATVLDPNLFPFRTQLVPLDADNFDLPAPSGWLLLILPPSYAGFSDDPTPDAPPPSGMQGFAAVRHEVTLPGGIGAAWEPAAVMGSAHCQDRPRDPAIPRRRLSRH
ncbi:MAG TPA: hypothetical protein PLS53_01475 [Thermoanaerobaculaceae bacterium]|mgnify:CR=1 FL=1|nr:hypothetical protein [Thermoanaerobaculaceae bacterium]HPS76807.1 hypothetical protein [Thermoanaerobaculaceae bacterium]